MFKAAALATVLVAGTAWQAQAPLANDFVYGNANGVTVYPGATQPTTFTITKPTVMTAIVNSHWGGGPGGAFVASPLADNTTG